jgi:hypothetical protein
MNCAECGAALLLDRVVFRCSCGAYVHAYCADSHIIHAHRPGFEEGYVDLNGEFRLKLEAVAVGELPAPEDDEESLVAVGTSAEGEEEQAEEVEQEDEDIETVTETPSDEGGMEVKPSEPERPDASSE